MLRERYFIKVVPHRGDLIHRFELTRKDITTAGVTLALLAVGALLFGIGLVYRAHSQVAALQSMTAAQSRQLRTIDAQTSNIRSQLQKVQHQNQQIRQMIGAPTKKAAPGVRNTSLRTIVRSPVALVARRVSVLAAASDRTLAESDALQRLTMHVLNVRHLQEFERAQTLAAIPSIDPVAGAQVVGCFCYRSYPDSEFHPGVDLSANYGDPVRASAAGTVASAGWDGGYGIKVDIDHGNGYHSWYAHLSRVDVRVGDHVYKGQNIALVGSTGFSTGPHLHYQLMLNGTAVDPTPYLDGVPAKVMASLP